MRTQSVVHSYQCKEYESIGLVFDRHLPAELLGVPSDANIVIKINMCDLRTPETGAVTHPLFLRKLVLHLKRLYPDNRILVAESDATVVMADEFFEWLGYKKALQDLGVDFVNLHREPQDEVPIDGYIFNSLPLPAILKGSYFISLAKLKTNVTSMVTLVLKNQYAFVRGLNKSKYHKDVHRAIVDANVLRKPDFSMVDGILGQGGSKAPAFGVPVRANRVIFGKDPVAVDTYCAKLMGISPRLVPHIVLSERRKIGSMDYEVETDISNHRVTFEASILGLLFFKTAGKLQRLIQASFRGKNR